MTNNHQRPEAIARGACMLRTAFGSAIARLLEDPAVVEVMLNPDGRIWIDRLSESLANAGEMMSPADGERIVRLVAHPRWSGGSRPIPARLAELPETGEPFEGLLPPVVAAPAFAIRKPAVAVFTLDDHVAAEIMMAGQAATLRAAVAERANILVAGAPRPARRRSPTRCSPRRRRCRIVSSSSRTRELQCAAPNRPSMNARPTSIAQYA